jgi:phage terminase large subunit GpA-like protein
MRMKLDFDRDDALDDQARLDKVAETARLLCPHCGSLIDDAQRDTMVDRGVWVFEGQAISEDGTVTGAPIDHDTAGFWIHGTMSKVVSLAALAKEYVSALVVFERTRDPQRLKRATVKSLGEVYEGGGARGFDPKRLKERADEAPAEDRFDRGTVPDEVFFVTAAVDVGGTKFDVIIIGWDLEGRSWIIDRFTIKQRPDGHGNMIDLRPRERIEDWDVIRTQVLNRTLPLALDETLRMPVAAVAIDDGDGNATWKAREFARRMALAKQHWGKAPFWQKVRLVKGASKASAPMLPVKPTPVNVDEDGREVKPSVDEWLLGVWRLKEQTLERLALDEDGPGFVRFADGLPASTYEEFGGEALVDGKWERRGPNESLDLFGYAEAARLMLKPDRKEIAWDTRVPQWARPVPISSPGRVSPDGTPLTSAQAPAKQKKTLFDRFDRLNAGD